MLLAWPSAFRSPSVARPFRLLAVLLLCASSLAACDALGEPERFYNDDAQPPMVAGFDFADLVPGQHLAGVVQLRLNLDSLAGRIVKVEFWVDDRLVEARTSPPYAFTLITPAFPDGERLVSVRVDLAGRRGGLLEMAGMPDLLFAIPLMFDQTPPARVRGVTARMEGNRPLLSWTPSTQQNVYAYVIHRFRPRLPLNDSWVPVDTIYDRTASSFLDVPYSEGIGGVGHYRVLAWNRHSMSPPSDEVTLTYGDARPALYQHGNGGAFSADGRTLYTTTFTELVAYATDDHRELRRVTFASRWPDGLPPLQIVADPAGAELFALVQVNGIYRYRVQVLDAATLAVRRSFLLPSGVFRVAPGPAGRLLAAGEGRFHVLDPQSGEVVASSGVELAPEAQVVGPSPDGRSAYVMSPGSPPQGRISRVTLDEAVPRAVAHFERPGGVGMVQVGSDGRLYVYTHPRATVLDGHTLSEVGGFDLGLASGPDLGARAFVVVGGRLYVSAHTGGFLADPSGMVAAFDLATGLRTQTWWFAGTVHRLRTTGTGRLYVDSAWGGSTTWLLSL